jgi:hypothetical protein
MSKVIQKMKEEKVEGKYIELTGSRAADVSKRWKVEILQGYNSLTLEEVNYAVRLTSTLNNQAVTFSKADLEDNSQSKKIVRRLGKIGVIKASFIKEIENSVNEALYDQQEKIITVGDINSVIAQTTVSGVAPEKYYSKFLKCFKDNQDKFPSHSSSMYDPEHSLGVILDNKPVGESGHYPVAIQSGELKELFKLKSDNVYREVLESLVNAGLIKGELEEQEVEVVEVSNDGNKTTRTKTKKKRLDKRIRMFKKGEEVNVFIFDINLEKGE